MNEAMEAAKDLVVLVNKQISNLENSIKNIDKDPSSAPCVCYKGDFYFSYDELHEAFGCDAFDMKTFERLEKELAEEIKSSEKSRKKTVMEKKIKYLNHFRKELLDTMEMEEEKNERK